MWSKLGCSSAWSLGNLEQGWPRCSPSGGMDWTTELCVRGGMCAVLRPWNGAAHSHANSFKAWTLRTRMEAVEHPEVELSLWSCRRGPNPLPSLTMSLGRSLTLLGCLYPQNMQDSGLLCGWLLLAAPRAVPTDRTGREGVARMLSARRRRGEPPPGDGDSPARRPRILGQDSHACCLS